MKENQWVKTLKPAARQRQVCAVVRAEVSGATVGTAKSRIDFNLPETTLDRQALTDALNARIATDSRVFALWIGREGPDLIRTMTVRPPAGQG